MLALVKLFLTELFILFKSSRLPDKMDLPSSLVVVVILASYGPKTTNGM